MKKIALCAVILVIPFSLSLYAMGLGDLKVHSHLDQPFNAEIELIDVGGTPLSGIKANLASAADFERVGLERSYALGLLTFAVEKNANGNTIIKVGSAERITEPFMQILVDLAWAEGQVYRSYTVLLDPPNYPLDVVKSQMQHNVKGQSGSQALAQEAGVIDRSVYTQVERASSSTTLNNRGVATYGPTTANETIWQVAQHYKTADILLQQLILAIVGTNPQSFTEGNLNGLKEGSHLQIPATSTANKVPVALAKLEVLAHDRAWQSRQAIEHALLPPYIGSNSPNTANDQEISPLGYPLGTSIVQSVPASLSILPLTSSLLGVGKDYATTPTATASAPNASLVNQLSFLQADNKKLQQQLARREQEMKQLRSTLHLKLTQKAGMEQMGQKAHAAEKGSIWPWTLFLLGAGGLIYWWLWTRPKPEMSEDIAVSSNTLPVRPIISPPPVENKFEVKKPVEVVSKEPLSPAASLPIKDDKVSPAVVSVEEAHDINLPSQETLADEHVLDFEAEQQEAVEETPVAEVVPEPLTKRKIKQKSTQEDDHKIEFESNPVDPLPTEESTKPLKSKVALDTLLALAKTYIGMEDFEAAKQSLQEVLDFGSKKQQLEAKGLLDELIKKK